MMEEHFMRGWNHGHDRLSADLDRGFRKLGTALQRWAKLVTTRRTPDADAEAGFNRSAAVIRPGKRAVPARAARRR